MRVRWEYAIKVLPHGVHPSQGSSDVAKEMGLRWVHGLIDTDRFERNRTYQEERTEEWEADFGSQDLDDDMLRVEVL